MEACIDEPLRFASGPQLQRELALLRRSIFSLYSQNLFGFHRDASAVMDLALNFVGGRPIFEPLKPALMRTLDEELGLVVPTAA